MKEPANLIKNGTCKGEIIEDSQCNKDKNKYNNEDLYIFILNIKTIKYIKI